MRATDGAVPSVKFEFSYYRKIKIYKDETNNNITSLIFFIGNL